MAEIKENFFKKPEPVTMTLIQFLNDPEFRVGFGLWCHKHFDSLTSEFKTHGRFLTLKEINSHLEFSDLP